MKVAASLSALSMLAAAEAAETVLGAYIFHRHGDRTPKALAPTNLTTLGYEQVYTSGQYYRSRYLSGSSKIRGISEDEVKLSQLAVTAPVDNVLQNSAMGFLQGLYPPVQTVQTLANGQSVQAPMDGCQAAKTSSNSFFSSAEYKDLSSSTKDLYASIVPAINNVIPADQVSFKNAYVVYDILNVASIHNTSSPSTPSNSTLNTLRTLADAHEWHLAFNASNPMRAVAGMQLAGEILSHMDSLISSQGATKLGIQFGAYATFMSFFGLAGLDSASQEFKGVVDYASSLAVEMFTEKDLVGDEGFPSERDVQIRFLFHNGTASNSSKPAVYPLFGGGKDTLMWTDFRAKMLDFAIGSTQQWCEKCGNQSGSCAAYAAKTDATAKGNGAGVSPAVGGVIGAFVTLAVVLGTLGAVMLVGGFTLVSKKRVEVEEVGVETKA